MKSKAIFITLLFYLSLFGQVNTEQYRLSSDSSRFIHQVGVNVNYSNGNSDIFQMTFNGRSDFLKDKYELLAIMKYKRATENSRVFTSQGFLHLRAIYFSSEKTYLELFLQKEFNKFIKLDDRNVAGFGIRYKWMKSKNTMLFSGVGVMHEHEKLSDVKSLKNSYKGRLTSYNSFVYENKKWRFNIVNYYQPNLKLFNDFRLLVDSNIKVKLSNMLSFVTSFSMRYDHMPPADVKANDIFLSNGIEFRF